MRPAEALGLGELAGDAAADLVRRIEETHAGIAGRAFAATGPAAAPVRLVHDRIAREIYGTVRSLTRAGVRAGGAAVALTRAADSASIETRAEARMIIGAVNGAFGSALEGRAHNPLVIGMAVRCDGRDVALDRGALAAAFPDATPRVAVFLHGLCETDDAWRLGAARSRPYGDRLREELAITPVYIRYNTGRRISSNGRELSALLEQLVAAWPVAVGEIALVGHSMGGLVARSATHYGSDAAWTAAVRQLVSLGVPHRGAELERAALRAAEALRRLPETRSLGAALENRSHGIQDLAHGHIVDEDWGAGHRSDVPFLPGAEHFFISSSLAPSHESLSAKLIGDLLVLRDSAWDHEGPGRPMRFPVDHYRHLGGVSHFALLNHPAVYDQLRRWLAPRPALTA